MVSRGFLPENISDWFWNVVEDAKRNRERLAALLSQLNEQEVVRFHHEFKEAACQLTGPPYTDHIEDFSEDGIQDVAEWVVSQGKRYYSRIWDNPEEIPKRIESGNLFTFSGVADNIYWDRFGRSIPAQEA